MQRIAALLLITVLPVHAAGDVKAGEQRAAACMACHGAQVKQPRLSIPIWLAKMRPILTRHYRPIRKGNEAGDRLKS